MAHCGAIKIIQPVSVIMDHMTLVGMSKGDMRDTLTFEGNGASVVVIVESAEAFLRAHYGNTRQAG